MFALSTCVLMWTGVCCVVEIQLTLTYAAIQSLAIGEPLTTDIDEENIRVTLIASEDAVSRFQSAAKQVALMLAATGPKH